MINAKKVFSNLTYYIYFEVVPELKHLVIPDNCDKSIILLV